MPFLRRLYRDILQGIPGDAPIIADELASSAKAIIRYATDRGEYKNFIGPQQAGKPQKDVRTQMAKYADDLLLLIADKRFCRHLVEEAPGTALAFFKAIADSKKYGVQIEVFGKNITNQALENADSFLYHEAEGYASGLLGYFKPLSLAMYGNYRMVETVGTLLDPDVFDRSEWGAHQLEAYCRIVTLTFKSYVESGSSAHSFVLYRAIGNIESAAGRVYKLNGKTYGELDSETVKRLRECVDFTKGAIEILDANPITAGATLRVRKNRNGAASRGTMYDHIAELMVKIISNAASVSHPRDVCWHIQMISVWMEFFRFTDPGGAATKLIRHKVRRLVYDEIADMSRFPNFQGARVLSLCLNTMGLAAKRDRHSRATFALQKAVHSWTRKHYAALHIYNQSVAEECLVDGFSYDQNNNQIVRIYPVEGLRREEYREVLQLDPPEKYAASREWNAQ